MILPYDVARCCGTQAVICTDCRRREPGRAGYQTRMLPPASALPCDLHAVCEHVPECHLRIAPLDPQ